MNHSALEDAVPMRPARLAVVAVTLLALSAWPSPSLAHAELVSSTPADGAALDAPPEEVVLAFDSELVPDGTSFTVSDATAATVGNGELDLAVAERNELRGPVAITAAGTYTVAWTAVALDGHAESGRLTFSVTAPAHPDSPDTATAAPSAPWPALLGLALVLAAVLVARRIRGPA